MDDHVVREIDLEKISAINKVINSFFDGKDLNECREGWFSPSSLVVPHELRDICDSIGTFFKRRTWHAGGPIPEDLLYTRRNFRLINNIALVDAIELAYDSIAEQKTMAKTPYVDGVEILLVLNIIHQCEKSNIPQDHIGGLMLLYLELCEKVVLL